MYIYIYVYTCIYLCVYLYFYRYLYLCTCIYINIHTPSCLHLDLYPSLHVYSIKQTKAGSQPRSRDQADGSPPGNAPGWPAGSRCRRSILSPCVFTNLHLSTYAYAYAHMYICTNVDGTMLYTYIYRYMYSGSTNLNIDSSSYQVQKADPYSRPHPNQFGANTNSTRIDWRTPYDLTYLSLPMFIAH